MFNDMTFLITGGTGSLGQALTRHLLTTQIKELRLFSRDEEKQLDMQRSIKDKRIKYIIGNIRDLNALKQATYNVHVLIHTAALKIIPVCETHPLESIKTNLQGTLNVKTAATYNRVIHNIFINTDKAVNPVNVYGACKMLAEKTWLQRKHTPAKFCSVRYGNVINSRGSIIPYFKQLITQNKPLQITHPEMTRFLITMQQAIKMIMYTASNMHHGYIYVPKIKAVRIVDLAVHLSSPEYPVKITGIRQGEKLHETLIDEDETRRTEAKPMFYVIHPYGTYTSKVTNQTYNSLQTIKYSKEELEEIIK